MAYTDNCDLYAAFHEDGINLVIRHIMRQRPSLFNYATANLAKNQEMWCSPVHYTSDVQRYGNPLFTVLSPLPVLGADSPPVGLDFIVQLTDAKIDFFPSNAIKLPAELNPPLPKQHFALEFRICGSIACPSDEEVSSITPSPPKPSERGQPPPPQVVLRGRTHCFCLMVYVVGHFELTTIAGTRLYLGKVDGLDIVDIEPDALEENLVCYLKTTVNVLLREKLTIPMDKFFLSFPLFNLATVTLSPTPNPPIPNNPAVEDDQLKGFITVTVV